MVSTAKNTDYNFRPSQIWFSCECYQEFIENNTFWQELEVENHFALFEIGFNPLTLLVATHKDYLALRSHYQAVT